MNSTTLVNIMKYGLRTFPLPGDWTSVRIFSFANNYNRGWKYLYHFKDGDKYLVALQKDGPGF